MKALTLEYHVPGDDFTRAGEASSKVKNMLKRMGFDSDTTRRVAIAMYEGEINMVIHGGGGNAFVSIYADRVEISLVDHGPGIADVDKAMQEGYSTAPDNVRALGFGAGMGLPNIKKYADVLQVESVTGEGTTLKMTILAGGK